MRTDEYIIAIKGKSYTVEVRELGQMQDGVMPLLVLVDGAPYEVRVETIGQKRTTLPMQQPSAALKPAEMPVAPKVTARPALGEKGAVTAPMPGKIVALRVKAGERVKVGDTLLTLEAMKMENEIKATAVGIVKELHVVEGSMVSAGDVLLLIE